MSHQVYTKNHLVQGTMTAAEWEFFNRIVDDYRENIPSPSIVVSLLASPEVQLKRIESRGRSFESGYTLSYLSAITDRLGEYAESLAGTDTLLLPFDTEQLDLTLPSSQQNLLALVRPHLA